jgi:hypothetical protein
MPSFIEDILSDAQGQSVPVATLLRRVKVAVSKLDNKKVEEWVDKELKGYGPEDEVPEYREIKGSPIARGVVGGWEPIIFPADAAKFSKAPIGQSIPAMESQIINTKGSLIFPYPPQVMAMLNKTNRRQMIECGVKFDPSALVAIVEAVRTLILEWALESAAAGITGSSETAEADRAKAAPVSINIGSIGYFTGNLGAGNIAADITSSAVIDRVQYLIGEIKSHVGDLTKEGLNETELRERVAAVENEIKKSSPDHKVLRSLLDGLREIFIHASGGLVSSGVIFLLNQVLGTGVPIPG